MKHLRQAGLALVVTLALLLAQSGLLASVKAEPVRKMDCCGDACPTHCCVDQKDAGPEGSVPAVPAVTSVNQLQAALVPDRVKSVRSQTDRSICYCDASRVSPFLSSVPLYVRTHSFLI